MIARDKKAALEFFRTLLFCLALMALLLRSFIPAGFMPEAGKAAMVICTASGPATIEIPAGQDPAQPRHAGVAHAPCVFAPGFITGTLAAATALIAPIITPEPPTIADEAFVVHLLSKPYSSQAPPRLS